MSTCRGNAVVLLRINVAPETPGEQYSRETSAFRELAAPAVGGDVLIGAAGKTEGYLDAFAGLGTCVGVWERVYVCRGVVEGCEGQERVGHFWLEEALHDRVEEDSGGWDDIPEFLDIFYCRCGHRSEGKVERVLDTGGLGKVGKQETLR